MVRRIAPRLELTVAREATSCKAEKKESERRKKENAMDGESGWVTKLLR